jgi:hypothetical protein
MVTWEEVIWAIWVAATWDTWVVVDIWEEWEEVIWVEDIDKSIYPSGKIVRTKDINASFEYG